MKYEEINGDLIELAKQGKFEVIVHGCNCFCTMGAGIAPQMAKAFGCDKYEMEKGNRRGDYNKLGQIEYDFVNLENGSFLGVVNAYTQYEMGINRNGIVPLDYDALTLCMRKIGHRFYGKHIGLPLIGCGLAGGDWNVVKAIIMEELKNCHITVVKYSPPKEEKKEEPMKAEKQ